MVGFVGVHVGAGLHSGSLENKYKQLCQEASKHGVVVLRAGGSALDAVVAANALLEASPLTNAGFGSNLSWDGRVECDAGVMDGAHLTFGACGAVSGVSSPASLARHICDAQRRPLSLGRVPPVLLAGEGARQYATELGLATVHPDSLISEKALKMHKQCKRKLIKYEQHVKKKAKFEEDAKNEMLDTVGAVCVDADGNIAVACSSGGIVLKRAGRIGQAAILGAGCWADDQVGVVSTGCGEHLIATALARAAATNIRTSDCPTSALRTTFQRDFLDSAVLRRVEEKLAGLLVVDFKDGRGEMLYAHTTQSMCIGYMSTSNSKPKSRMSRLPEGSKPGCSFLIEGVCF